MEARIHMITLINVYYEENRHAILYNLLGERTPEQSISHKGLPGYPEHVDFVESLPYKIWFFVHSSDEDDYVGTVYLTRQNEIGIFIFNKYQCKGYGRQAVTAMMESNDGPFLANINPLNTPSAKMFESLGFKHLQNTLRYD